VPTSTGRFVKTIQAFVGSNFCRQQSFHELSAVPGQLICTVLLLPAWIVNNGGGGTDRTMFGCRDIGNQSETGRPVQAGDNSALRAVRREFVNVAGVPAGFVKIAVEINRHPAAAIQTQGSTGIKCHAIKSAIILQRLISA